MRYKYKVRELGKETSEDMEAMSLKKYAIVSCTSGAGSIYYTLKSSPLLFDNQVCTFAPNAT